MKKPLPLKNRFFNGLPPFRRVRLVGLLGTAFLLHAGIGLAQETPTKGPRPGAAPTGTIEGNVTDYETNEALIGATVVVQGMTLGGAADATGAFRITGVPIGVQTLNFSFIGYQPASVPNVQVKTGTVTKVDFKLVPSGTLLGEVVIKARVETENSTEISLLTEIQGARNIVTGISNEQISRSLDRNAAEVMRRVSGVTLVNDRFVVIRGLDPRYTLTLLNDLPTPSSENDRRSFSYDMLNSSVIDRITVYKTPAPELQGDFAGGVVKVYTKSSANARQWQVQLSGQYRPGSSFADFYTYQGGKYDQLGFDDGARALPAGFPGLRAFPQVNSAFRGTSANVPDNVRLARTLPNNWNLLRDRSTFDKRAVVNYYDTWKLGKSRLSSLTSLTYTITRDVNYVDRQFRPATVAFLSLERVVREPAPAITTYPQVLARDTLTTESARLGAMQNFRWNINERHSIEFKNFFNQLSRDQTTVRDYRTTDIGSFTNTLYKAFQYYFRSRGLYTGILSGDHRFGRKDQRSVQWRLGYATTNDQQPDQRRFQIQRSDTLAGSRAIVNTPPQLPGYYLFGLSTQANQLNYARYYSSLQERVYTAGADFENNFGKGWLVRVGFFNEYRKRDFQTRWLTYALPTPSSGFPALLNDSLRQAIVNRSQPQFSANRLFDPGNFREDGSGYTINDVSQTTSFSPAYYYDASNQQHAGYVAVNVPLLGERLNVYGGVRVEWNQRLITAPYIDKRRSGRIVNLRDNETKLLALPSVNVSYRFVPKMLVRAAYGKTLNRPELREAAPFNFYDFNQIAFFQGTIGLKTAEVQNADLRWEYYPTADEMVSVGLYYKNFKNAIENVSSAASNAYSDEIRYVNNPEASAYGLELELRKRLSFIPGAFFGSLSVIGNATLLYTRVKFDAIELQGSPFRRAERPMQGASPYAVNGGIYYDNQTSGTQATVLYNVIGQRLTYPGGAAQEEIFEQPRQVLDFSVTQRITRFLSLRAGVQDLLNQPYRFSRDVTLDGKYNPDLRTVNGQGDYLESTYRPGSYYSFGVLFAL
ncbi:MAG: TonB-dependent receptor [Ferruginibacter sp.]|nr:TonB-dependent receptor [Cytophagales bacterium]